jgi:hypothetical protein
MTRSPSFDHVPVNIIVGAVQIEQRARRMGNQKRRPGRLRHRYAKPVDMAILQPQLRERRVTHPFEHRRRISAARMRHRHQHRDSQP